MSETDRTSLADKVQNLELCLRSHHGQEVNYGRALREAIIANDHFTEIEVLKSLGDLHLRKGKLARHSAEFDKASALYSAALMRLKDKNILETLKHRLDYMTNLSMKLFQLYIPQFLYFEPDYWGTPDQNCVRVAEICVRIDQKVAKQDFLSAEDTYTQELVAAITKGDVFVEQEILKSLGDLYLAEGKETCQKAQLIKAGTMYNKALFIEILLKGMGHAARPEVEETLHHRIRYTNKVWEAKSRPLRDTPNREESSQTIEQILKKHSKPASDRQTSGSSIQESRTDVAAAAVEDNTDPNCQHQDYLNKGDASLVTKDLDSAEKHFAGALRVAHVRDPTAKQYQTEVEPLCKLGDVYCKRGQQTGDGGDFVKAAALYNAAIVRSIDEAVNGKIRIAITNTEKAFVRHALGIHESVTPDNSAKHKQMLKEIRDQIKLEMETIDQQLDPYVHNADDSCVKETEAKRAQAVRQLFERIAADRKEFISLLVEECMTVIGPPPCKHSLMGLGSQATGLVTPYSDLEFAILVEDESEESLAYFRKLTHFLHLKVVNLGETILPALGIKSLNDFNSKKTRDSWYHDSVTPRGFAFDGSMPKASKTPLGRQGTNTEPPSELIRTPGNMASMLQNDVTMYLEKGYHLSTVLRNPCLISGDQNLFDIYMGITVKILQANGGKMAIELAQDTLMENIKRFNDTGTVKAQIMDVKKGLYRFPALAVDCLALTSGVMPTTVWETIDEMKMNKVVSAENAHHLAVLVSISAELRLRTYIANGGQKENLSALASMKSVFGEKELPVQSKDESQQNAVTQVFYLSNEKQLFRYYYTALPLKAFLSKLKEMKTVNSIPELYDSSSDIQARMYFELCEYKQAIELLDKALSEDVATDRTILLHLLGNAWQKLGDHQKAIRYQKEALDRTKKIYGDGAAQTDIAKLLYCIGSVCERASDYEEAVSYYDQALQMFWQVYGRSTAHSNIATTLNRLGTLWERMGDPKKAIHYATQALQMEKTICSPNTTHLDIAIPLNTLGCAFHSLGNYIKSLAYLEQALQMTRSLYGQYAVHPNIALSLSILGKNWRELRDSERAIVYLEQALQMCRNIYGEDTAHPDIANIFTTMGMALHDLGEYRRARSNHDQALQMFKNVYGQTKPHPETATALNNLGLIWYNLGDYKKAISYYDKALHMYRCVYGEGKAHFNIATSLNNLGQVWDAMGNHRKGIEYFEQALEMCRTIVGKGSEHPLIADIHNNLGAAWNNLNGYTNAIAHYESALKIYRSIHGPSKAHPDIAMSLGNLGTVWGNCYGDYRQAISYHEQALHMYRSIHGQTATHAKIATSLNNLGDAWIHLGETRKGISYFEQALKMYRSGQTKANQNVATVLFNLGKAWMDLGENRKSVDYLEQALLLYRGIYGQATPHPDVALLLATMARVWLNLADRRKAIRHHEQALQMYRSIHGQRTPHPDIANILTDLGVAWCGLGDHKTANSYYEEALQMFRRIHGQGKAHLHIANLLTNMGANMAFLGCETEALRLYEEASIMTVKLEPSDIRNSLMKQIEENLKI
ncbi:PREDICTED: uncharacterized protein LOC109476455 isoform X1 [Branchiostoma belcheri]|uniref:Uncharacterized protein LOC109476455 isoform X1 n=1 Tax=Branchiostoma belcheri TaxID=7741 RepID=A0A6P4ZPN7_BRABE|nr:PREDICTED: uncharacterized protein LOC109476455 isoform X1 [Branchiostoma belcheri]